MKSGLDAMPLFLLDDLLSTYSEIGRHLLMFPKEIKVLRFNPLVSISWINCDESGKSQASARIYTYYKLMNLLKVTKALYQSQNG